MKKFTTDQKTILLFAFIPLIISIILLIKTSGESQLALYWFLIAFAFILLPYISEIKFKDYELKLQSTVQQLYQRRFANLTFIISIESGRTALGYHPFLKRWLPPGRRLKINEAPDESIYDIIEDQLGIIESKIVSFYPTVRESEIKDYDDHEKKGGKVVICEKPYQVQREIREQRDGIPEHYDFVYVCLVNEEIKLTGVRKASWFNLYDIKMMSEDNDSKKRKTFPDVFYSYKKIVKNLIDDGLLNIEKINTKGIIEI